MKQADAVYQAIKQQGGVSTLGTLYHTAMRVPDCEWKTKTPFASVRRIVQEDDRFFKIKPGLWALEENRSLILKQFAIAPENTVIEKDAFNHTYYQGLLAELGNLKKFETYIPSQDKNKLFLNQKLAEVASLEKFHKFTYDKILRRGRTIDVVWFNKRKFPDTYFEVEHSTDFQNSLLKFTEFQDFRIKFVIVADKVRKSEFESKLAQSAFEPIRCHVQFLDYEKLVDWHTKTIVAESPIQELNL